MLFVERADESRNVMTEMLTWAGGFRVVTASTVAEASMALEAAPFSLVITDSVLPDGSGMQLIDAARRAGLLAADVPVMVVSAHPISEPPPGAMVETKPLLEPEAFVERLRALLFDDERDGARDRQG